MIAGGVLFTIGIDFGVAVSLSAHCHDASLPLLTFLAKSAPGELDVE